MWAWIDRLRFLPPPPRGVRVVVRNVEYPVKVRYAGRRRLSASGGWTHHWVVMDSPGMPDAIRCETLPGRTSVDVPLELPR